MQVARPPTVGGHIHKSLQVDRLRVVREILHAEVAEPHQVFRPAPISDAYSPSGSLSVMEPENTKWS
jgi:hypothetical protein